MSGRTTRLVGMYAVIAAAASVILAPLLALSYFATSDGGEELEVPTVSAWAEPGRDLAGGLVTFASADRVYSTYLQVFALLFPAVFLCAWALRAQRPPSTGPGRWGWRLALLGYLLFGAGLIVIAILLVAAAPSNTMVNIAFLALMFPGLLLGLIGSTVVGIGLVRTGYRPRLTAWLLALSFLLWIVGSFVLGHNSLGMVPLFVAWATTGWHFWRRQVTAAGT